MLINIKNKFATLGAVKALKKQLSTEIDNLNNSIDDKLDNLNNSIDNKLENKVTKGYLNGGATQIVTLMKALEDDFQNCTVGSEFTNSSTSGLKGIWYGLKTSDTNGFALIITEDGLIYAIRSGSITGNDQTAWYDNSKRLFM